MTKDDLSENGKRPANGTISSGVSIDVIKRIQINANLDEKVIITTEDKVRLCLKEYIENFEGSRFWIAPGGIFLTLIATIITAEFRDWIFRAELWKALFILLSIFSFVWLVRSLWRRVDRPKLEDLIKDLNKGTSAADD